MNQTDHNLRPEPDAVKSALEVLGDRWTFLILREAFFGERRFGHFQRNLGIGRNVLASRLAALVENGLLRRVRYRKDPDWYEYQLTSAGLDLFPAILTIKQWAESHLLDPAAPTLQIRHRPCGAELSPVVVCESCGEPVQATDVEIRV
jgi:DNA-binding HxlR family transcriptional regulator